MAKDRFLTREERFAIPFLDLLVENQIIIEIKATATDNPYYQIQLHTHLRLLGIASGLLINFGKNQLRDGVLKITNL